MTQRAMCMIMERMMTMVMPMMTRWNNVLLGFLQRPKDRKFGAMSTVSQDGTPARIVLSSLTFAGVAIFTLERKRRRDRDC
jgi:hypothetical protein